MFDWVSGKSGAGIQKCEKDENVCKKIEFERKIRLEILDFAYLSAKI